MPGSTRRQFIVCGCASTIVGCIGTSDSSPPAAERPVTNDGEPAGSGAADESAASNDQRQWRTGPAMPDARTEVGAATLEGRLYVVGGFVPNDSRHPVTDDVLVFDPNTDTWADAEPIPAPLHHVAVAATDTRIYVIGGFKGDFNPVDSVWIFDGTTWTAGEPLPTPRGALTAGLVDGQIYVAGGNGPEGAVATLEVYDPDADSWATAAPMPTAREHLASGVIDGTLYAIGGRVESTNVGTAERYDPESDTWRETEPMPTPRSGHAATVAAKRLYVFGGESRERTFDEAEAYDPRTDRWETLTPMPTPRHGLGAVTIDGDLYTAAGGPEPGFSYSAAVEVLERA